jgi:hypothetical protein
MLSLIIRRCDYCDIILPSNIKWYFVYDKVYCCLKEATIAQNNLDWEQIS